MNGLEAMKEVKKMNTVKAVSSDLVDKYKTPEKNMTKTCIAPEA